MTVQELKKRLEKFPDNAPVMILNTKTGSLENAQMPHTVQSHKDLVALFEPEGWHVGK